MLLGNNSAANQDFLVLFLGMFDNSSLPQSFNMGFPRQGYRSHTEPINQLVGGLGIAFKDLYKKSV